MLLPPYTTGVIRVSSENRSGQLAWCPCHRPAGTFPLTAEPYTQQLAELRDARQRAQALGQSAQLRALPVGGGGEGGGGQG